MSTRTRITRSKGKSDGLSLPTRMRPTRKETISGRDGGTALNTTFNMGQDQQQQMLTQTPQLPTQSPPANPVGRMETPAPMLPPGPHRPLTPCMPLQTAFRHKLWFAGFLVPSCPKHALVWGTVVRGFARRDLC